MTSELNYDLKQLSIENKCLFVLLCAERLVKCYQHFVYAFEDPLFDFEKVIKQSFSAFYKKDKKIIEKLLNEVKIIIHDTDEYDDVLADQALHAVLALYYAIEFNFSNDLTSIDYCLENAEEALAVYEYENANDKYTKVEIKWREDLFQLLLNNGDFDELAIEKIRLKNRNYMAPILD